MFYYLGMYVRYWGLRTFGIPKRNSLKNVVSLVIGAVMISIGEYYLILNYTGLD